MNNQIYQQPEMEIDLKYIIWKLLSQWKAVLLVALLAAALLCGLKHSKDVKAYNEKMAAQNENAKKAEMSLEDRIAEVMDVLPAEDRGSVTYMIEQKEMANDYKEYMGESILFNTNPASQRTLMVTCDINAENPGDLPAVLYSCQSYIRGDSFAEAIKAAIDPDKENCYISELVQQESMEQPALNNETGRGAFKFKIVLPEDIDAEPVITAATESLKAFHASVQAKYPGSIAVAEAQEAHIFDGTNADRKQNTLYVVNNLNNNIKTADTTLSAEQRAAVEAIMAIKSENAAEKMAAGGTENEPSNENAAAAPGWSKKYAVLGFLIGVIIYAFAYLFLLIVKGRAGSASSVENYTGARLLGEVYYERKKSGLLSMISHSKFVDKFHFRGKTDAVKQIDRMASSIEAVCAHADSDSLTILNLINDDVLSDSLMNSLKDAISNKGLSLNIVDIKEEVDEKGISQAGDSVIAVDDSTKINTISKVNNLCRDYGISKKGTIYTAYA